MEDLAYVLNMVSCFISNTLSWSVVVLIIAIIFKEQIGKKIMQVKHVKAPATEIEFTGNEVLDQQMETYKKITKQPYSKPAVSIEVDDNPVMAIQQIYAKIETAISEKFGEKNGYDVLASLVESKTLDSGVYIMLTSLQLLYEKMNTSAHPEKISKEQINNYKRNAEQIIAVIQNLPDSTK